MFNGFVSWIAIFTAALLAATLWYCIYFLKPYSKLPSWRLEFRIPYWILKRRPLDIVIMEKTIEQSKKYEAEGAFVVWFFKPMVVVYGDETVKAIVQEPSATYKPVFNQVFEFVSRKSIFSSDGEEWMRKKKVMSPAFYPKALRTYTSFMNSSAKTMVEKLTERKGKTIDDMSHFLAKHTLRLFYESSLGVREGNSKEEEKTIDIIQTIIEFVVSRFYQPWLYFDFALPIFPYTRRILKLEQENRKTYIKIVEKIKESVLSCDRSQIIDDDSEFLSPRPKPIGEIVIEDSLKNSSFSMEELANELNILIVAGFDTTANALMWIFYSLGLHPEIQERVYDEISTLKEEEIQYSDVQNLTYLDCVIKESLRMYTIPFVGRRLKKDVQCGNYLIPKDTDIVLFPFMLHRNPDIYPDPEKFDPDRFLDKNSKIKPWNHIPFIEGSRACIGKNYALLSMKTFIIHVLRNFKVISLDRAEDLTFKWSLVLSAAPEPRMKFVPRHQVAS